ncbi:MAG: MFS transporter [Acidobacteria bacterium]|nr:MFS transporter [Acidobacteriota bacterium]
MPRLVVDAKPLKDSRNFRLLYFGQLVSLLGSNLTFVAVPFQVYQETHSSLWVGVASFVQLPFLIVGSLWGGAAGDRIDKRTILVVGSLVAALASAGLSLNAQLHHNVLVALLVLAAISAGVAGFSAPIRMAAIPKLVAPQQLIAAYSLNQILVNVGTVLGAALGGVLLGAVGLTSCYLIDAVTFVVLAFFTGLMSPMKPSGDHVGVAMLRAIGDGFRYVRSNLVAQAVYVADLNAMVFGLPRALYPAMALTVYHGGPRTLGLLFAASGVGALVMAIFTGWIDRVRRQGRLIALVIMAWGAAMALFGVVHILWFGLVCLAFAGATDVISTILRNTVLQNAITDEFRGRISSVQLAVVTGGPRLGDLESGVVANFTSIEFSIVSGGIACIVGVLALLKWRPGFWRGSVD